MNQAAMIRAHLEAGHRLTQWDALQLFQCFRLGARIYDLKQAGMQIDRRMIRTNTGKRVAEYWAKK